MEDLSKLNQYRTYWHDKMIETVHRMMFCSIEQDKENMQLNKEMLNDYCDILWRYDRRLEKIYERAGQGEDNFS